MAKRTKNTPKKTIKKEETVKSKPVKSIINTKKSVDNSNLILAACLALFSFLIFWYFTPENTNVLEYAPSKTFFHFSSLVLSGIIFYIFGFAKAKVNTLLSGSLFFLLVLLSLSRMVLFPLGDYSQTEITNLLTFEIYRDYSYAPLIFFGLLSVWFSRDNINRIIESDIESLSVKNTEGASIIKRTLQSLLTHKTLALTLVIIITGLSSTILLHNLDDFDFWSDEKQVTQAAAGYYHTGKFQQWDFIKDKPVNGKEFDRNFPHLWMIAQSYKVFGVNEWSSRIVSVLGGILFILLGYFILTYFFKNKFLVLLFLASFALHPEEILLFRWTRMYGVLIPYFLIQFALAYKTLTTEGTFNFKNVKLNDFLTKYLNFNYKYLLLFIPLTIFGFWMHKSTTFTLPALFIFIIYQAATTRKIRFYVAIVIGIIVLVAGLSFFPRYMPTHVMTWFDKNNEVYFNLLYFFPLTKELALSALAVGLPMLYFTKNKEHRQKLTYFYIMSAFVLVLFVYVITYAVSFRYVSFLVPVSMVLSFYILFLVTRATLGKYVTFVLAAIILLSSGMNFINRYDDLYVQNFASKSEPSIAYKEIRENAKPGEAVFLQFAMHYYLQGMDTSVNVISMRHQRKYKYEQFLQDISKHKSGWLEWDTQHEGNIDTIVSAYVHHNFKKIHGRGIDNTWTEVFRYDSTMVITAEEFKTAQYLPTTNLNLEKPLALSFWVKMSPLLSGEPFSFLCYENKANLTVKADTLNGFTFKYAKEDSISTGKFIDDKWHHFVWQQTQNAENNLIKGNLFVDGRQVASTKEGKPIFDLVKFKIGLNFRGNMNEMRVYDHALSKEQINSIYNRGTMSHIRELNANGENFAPMNFWSKQ